MEPRIELVPLKWEQESTAKKVYLTNTILVPVCILPEGEPRPSTPRSKGRWSRRDLERLRPDVPTSILWAHILGSNLVAWERCKNETLKVSPYCGRRWGRSYRSRSNEQRIWAPNKVPLPLRAP